MRFTFVPTREFTIRLSDRNCQNCGRSLKDYRDCGRWDAALDCGGDCLDCITECEAAFPGWKFKVKRTYFLLRNYRLLG